MVVLSFFIKKFRGGVSCLLVQFKSGSYDGELDRAEPPVQKTKRSA